jgi:hypothetical protein
MHQDSLLQRIGFLCQKLYSTMQNGFAMHHTLQNDSSTKNKIKSQSLCKQTQMHIPILHF